MAESRREMDTFINVTLKGTKVLKNESVNKDLNQAIEDVASVATKLNAFRELTDITTRREVFVDYGTIFGTNGEYGTLITTTFIGDQQPGEDAKDRFNSMIPGIIRSALMGTGRYEEITVTL